uniref:RNA-directed DNA polymerase n=1 Tax=Panagrolaimus superbus TaxID=310955 RepID=A0A914Y7G8_9BILA
MIPTPTDLFDKLAGCSVFSLLDMSQAYHQMELEEDSKVLTTVSTPFGLFRYNTQPFGTKNAPGDFQQTMDEMLNENPSLEHSGSYFDDIIVCSKTPEEHHGHLRETLQRFMDWGFRLNFNKCKFYRSSVKFLGKVVDSNGIRPDPDKVAAIQKMIDPTDVSTLRTFLGMVNYYQEFIPMMRELREPLDNLLKSDAVWEWTDVQTAAVSAIKAKLTEECLLTHYDPRLPIIVAADASQHGMGGVISHVYRDGKEKPIQFFSRALNTTQQRYSQTEKEALALIAAVKTFHRYLEGRKFTLLTDHRALLALFGKKKGKPVLAMNRLHRWSLFLAAYDFDIQYRNTLKFGQADALSRLIVATKALPELYEEDEDNDLLNDAGFQQVMVSAIRMLPVTSEDIIQAYGNDQEAQKLLEHIAEAATADQKFYVVKSVIMMNNRVYIPQVLRSRILDQLHVGHPGINRMKALARQHVYWKNLTKDVEAVVSQCFGCIQLQKNPVKATLASWPVSIKPGDRVHMDFAGPILGKMLLITVDSCSKWMDIAVMQTANSANTISFMYHYIATNGSPRVLVTDNGTQFTSAEFSAFCKQNGITHITSPVYHPQSNGQAERMVDTVKRFIRKSLVIDGETLNLGNCVATFLQAYHSTPSKATPGECTPALAHLGRELRTSMDMIRPRIVENLGPDLKMEEQFNRKFGALSRAFQVPDAIYWRKRKDDAWNAGCIKRKLGSKMFVIEDDCGKTHRLHVNQMIHRFAALMPEYDIISADDSTNGGGIQDDHDFNAPIMSPQSSRSSSPRASPSNRSMMTASATPQAVPTPRRSQRIRRRPKRLQIDPSKKRYEEV